MASMPPDDGRRQRDLDIVHEALARRRTVPEFRRTQ
jgi:hypothetical protein